MNQHIQIYEYVTAEASRGVSFPASLLAEGRAMRDAICDDFQKLPGVEIERLASIPQRIVADGTLIIAPETDSILESLARQVQAARGRLLGPHPEAIRLTADKWELFHHLRAHGIPTPETSLLCDIPIGDPQVWKPRDGAGSLDTFRVENLTQAQTIRGRLNEATATKMLAQPYLTGLAASISFLIGEQIVPLIPCSQEIELTQGSFHYRGASLPLEASLAARAIELGTQAVRCIPGLRGYVGVDLILGESDWVIELNPRLTTSYLLLRQACRQNLAEAILKLLRGETVSLEWDETPRSIRV
jgi:predicted ATP-grasp superfamily ATP-dependent carboligase